MSLFGPPSPKYYRDIRQAISNFRNPYVEYINRTAEQVYAGLPPNRDAERAELLRKAVVAGHAVTKAGVKVGWLAPPMMSAPTLFGIAQVAFAHESPIYRGMPGVFLRGEARPYDGVVDALDSADAILEQLQREAERRRRNPFYWIDRGLRAVLGLPAYVASLVVGFDRRSLSEGAERALWWVSLAADMAGIYGFGLLIGWWHLAP